MNQINISYSLSEKDLECAICYNPIQPRIYSCTNCFTLYLCEECYNKSTKCPSCRNKTLYHHKQLEQLIQWDKCTNTNCPVQLLPWGLACHLDCCEYQPIPCLFCSMLTLHNWIYSLSPIEGINMIFTRNIFNILIQQQLIPSLVTWKNVLNQNGQNEIPTTRQVH